MHPTISEKKIRQTFNTNTQLIPAMRLAILILGKQNSGKRSTIKALIRQQTEKPIRQLKSGRQRLFLNKQFQSLNLDVYCISALPSEKNKKLKDRFAHWKPETLIVAEQPMNNISKVQ